MFPDYKFTEDAYWRASDRLVELGYAKLVKVTEAGPHQDIYWTPTGEILRKEAQRIYDTVMKEKGQAGVAEAICLWLILIEARNPIPPHE